MPDGVITINVKIKKKIKIYMFYLKILSIPFPKLAERCIDSLFLNIENCPSKYIGIKKDDEQEQKNEYSK